MASEEKEMNPLNFNKIKLYCILNNVQSWEDVPSCWNCRYERTGCKDKRRIYFFSDFKIKKFDTEPLGAFGYYGCNKWKKK